MDYKIIEKAVPLYRELQHLEHFINCWGDSDIDVVADGAAVMITNEEVKREIASIFKRRMDKIKAEIESL